MPPRTTRSIAQVTQDALGGPSAVLGRSIVVSVETGTLTLLINGTNVPGVPYLRADSFSVGDAVYTLQQKNFGLLVLGAVAPTPASPAQPTPTVTIVGVSGSATWNASTTAFEPTGASLVVQQRVNRARVGCWFYDQAALAATPTDVGAIEIELTLSGGEYPDLVLHTNTGAADTALGLLDDQGDRAANLVAGATTWVTLPLSWADNLRSGLARGVAVASLLYDADLYASGRLRFTSL